MPTDDSRFTRDDGLLYGHLRDDRDQVFSRKLQGFPDRHDPRDQFNLGRLFACHLSIGHSVSNRDKCLGLTIGGFVGLTSYRHEFWHFAPEAQIFETNCPKAQ